MTIQSPGDAASTAAWMDWNRPCLPCQLPTVHTLGFGPFLAGAAAATPLKPAPSRTATMAAATIRSHDRATVRRTPAEDFAVRKTIPPCQSGRGRTPRHAGIIRSGCPDVMHTRTAAPHVRLAAKLEDPGVRGAGQGRSGRRGGPHVLVQEAGEGLGLPGCVEFQVQRQVLRVVDGLADGEIADPRAGAGRREAVERLPPGLIIRDRVLDAQCGHGFLPILAKCV